MARKTDGSKATTGDADSGGQSAGASATATTKGAKERKKTPAKKTPAKKKAAKKTPAKKAAKKKAARKKKGKRGRPPGKWTLVTPAQLRTYPKKFDVTQAELAPKLDVSAQTVGNWLKGNSKPSEETQARLADLIEEGAPLPSVTQAMKRRTLAGSPEWYTETIAAQCNGLARQLLELAGGVPSVHAAKLSRAAALVLQVGSDDV